MTNKSILIILVVLTIVSCGKDEPEPQQQVVVCTPTYSSDIKTIINQKCVISGCHDDNSTIANYTNYAPLKERADNGRLHSYLFELKIMPPASSIQLTDEEQELIKCWLNNGAPEN